MGEANDVEIRIAVRRREQNSKCLNPMVPPKILSSTPLSVIASTSSYPPIGCPTIDAGKRSRRLKRRLEVAGLEAATVGFAMGFYAQL